jgi:hypothetical protein
MTTRRSTALGGAILVKALDDFDMMTEVNMAGKKAPDTNTTPGPTMTSIMKDLEGVAASTSSPAPVKLPKLRMAHGRWQPALKESWPRTRTDNPRLKSAITLLEAAKAAKLQMDRPISGEVDLTQVSVASYQVRPQLTHQFITHGLAFPATEVLAAVSSSNSTSSPYWHGVGRGYAPIPDLQLQHGSNTLAVIEIKTTDSLDDIVADNIFAFFPTYTMGMLAEYTNGTGPMPALLRPVSLAKGKYHRYRRPHDVKIVEQLLAQMWSTGATIGVITNLKRWFIVQSFGDGVFEMTEVPGTVNGQSNAMNIMLAMSFQALGMK